MGKEKGGLGGIIENFAIFATVLIVKIGCCPRVLSSGFLYTKKGKVFSLAHKEDDI